MATELSIQQRRALALAKARKRAAESTAAADPEEGAFGRFARGVGNVAADTLGIIPGAAMELGNLTGLTDFENTSGPDLLRRQGNELGVTNAPGEQAQGVAGMVGQGVGMGASLAAAPLAAASRSVPMVRQGLDTAASMFRRSGTQASGVAGAQSSAYSAQGGLQSNLTAMGQTFLAPAATRPTSAGVAELTAGGVAAGAGQSARDSYGENTWVAPVAEVLAGGVAGQVPATVGAGVRGGYNLAKDSVAGNVVKAVGRIVGLNKGTGGGVRASRSLAESASDPAVARQRLRGAAGDSGADESFPDIMTPAQRTGDEGIMSIAAKVRRDDPAALDGWKTAVGGATSSLRGRIRSVTGTEGAEPGASVEMLTQLRDDTIAHAESLATIAAADAATKIQRLGPSIRPEDASRIVMRNLETAKGEARAASSELWNSIPSDLPTMPTQLDDWYRTALADMGEDDVASVLPQVARRFFNRAIPEPDDAPQILDARGNPLREPVEEPDLMPSTFGELKVMRSELLRSARGLRRGASPDHNRARLLEEAADAINDDFANVETGIPEAYQGIFNEARKATRSFSRIYRQGEVGKLLGTAADGGDMVPDASALSHAFRGDPVTRGINADDIIAATKNNPETVGAMDDFLRHQFAQRVIRDGDVNLAAAETFKRENEAIFAARPNLRTVFDEVIDGTRSARDLAQQSSEVAKRLNDPKITRAQVFIARAGDGNISEGVSGIFSNARPRETMRATVDALRQDPTGQALQGFKSAVNDELLTRATRSSDSLTNNANNGEYISGNYLRSVLGMGDTQPDAATANIGRAIRELYSEEELAGLRRLANTAFQIERDIGVNPASHVTKDLTGKTLELMAGVTGAGAGVRINQATGLGNIQVPGMFADLARNAVRRGVNDPARRMIVDSLGNPDLLDTLLAGITDKPLTPNHRRTLANWVEGLGPVLESDEEPEPITIDITRGNRAPAPSMAPAPAPQQAAPAPAPAPQQPSQPGRFDAIYQQVQGR